MESDPQPLVILPNSLQRCVLTVVKIQLMLIKTKNFAHVKNMGVVIKRVDPT